VDEERDAPKPTPRDGDADVLALAEGLLLSLGRTFDRGDIEVLKTVVESYPDLGRDGAGDVVESLNGLLSDFLEQELCDRDAVAVHIRAWRFMANRKPDTDERQQILSGLHDVRDLYHAA
jgi:hypothetical protein